MSLRLASRRNSVSSSDLSTMSDIIQTSPEGLVCICSGYAVGAAVAHGGTMAAGAACGAGAGA